MPLSFFQLEGQRKAEEASTGENLPEQKEQKVKRKLAHNILTGMHDTVGVSMKKIDV